MDFINRYFETGTAVTVIKWVIMILITAFIAQFGKQFAEFMINKFRKSKKGPSVQETRGKPVPETNSSALKSEKKLEKARIKRMKKTGGD